MAREPEPDDPLVCICMKVKRSTLQRAILRGASDLPRLMDATRAGTGCGTCRCDLLGLLAEQAVAENAPLPENRS